MSDNSAFDQWYNGMVGFNINSERILYDLLHPHANAADVRKWMEVCWNNALEAAHQYNGVDVEALEA